MTIAIQTGQTAAISTYTGLIEAIGRWLNNTGLEDSAPDLIALAEARFNRILPVNTRETTTTLSTTSGELTLPTDFSQAKALFLDTDPRQPLQPLTLASFRTYYAAQTTGKPQAYAISNGSLLLGPSPDDIYSLVLTYIARIAPLSENNQANWLLSAHPDIYLYGALVQAEALLFNDERVGLWKAALDEAIGELIDYSNRARYGAAPLRMRPSVAERL